MREKSQGLAFAMLLFQAGQILLAGFMGAQTQDGRFGKGPLQGSVTDFLAGSSGAFAGGFLGTLDQAAIRPTILDAGEALDIVTFIKHDEGQDCAHAWDRAQPVKGVSIMVLGRVYARQCQVCEALVLGANEGESDLNALVDRGIGEALGDAVAIGFGGDFLADLREGVLARGILDMRQELRAFPPAMQATPYEVTGGPHLRRIAIRLRQPTSPEEGRNLWRIDRVVCGLAAMKRLHGEGMAQDEGKACSGTEIRQPVPGKETLDSHHPMVARGRNRFQERLWSGLHVAVHEDFSVMAQEADVHAAGMQVDPTIKLMLLGGESHGGLLRSEPEFPSGSIPPWDAEEEASIIINALQR
jgi:hypothetical protein